MHKLRGTYYKQNCLENQIEYIELHVIDNGLLNIEAIANSSSVLMDVDGAKKLRKALKKYIKSQEEK